MKPSAVRLFAVVVAWFGALVTGECASQKLGSDYRLQPGDIVRVQVFQEPDLDREVRVSNEGEIFLPLIGRIEANGTTIGWLEVFVRDLYNQDYLVNPQVNVTVVKYQVRTVNVIGAVNAPQAIEYPPEQPLSLVDAISRAGGFNRFADRRKVRLTRALPDGKSQNFIVNADDLISGDNTKRWILLADDVIFVPERIL